MGASMKRSTYNREYYTRLKAFKAAHPDSPTVRRWNENIREKSKRLREANMERYADEQQVIRTARKARGWTQKDLGAMLGYSLQYVCHWEKGRSPAPWEKLYEVMPELKEARK